MTATTATPMTTTSLRLLERFYHDCAFDFDLLSDYIWKSVRLIEHEATLELAKLNTYHPGDVDRQRRRWKLEGLKLQKALPAVISRANFLSAMTLFATRLLILELTLE